MILLIRIACAIGWAYIAGKKGYNQVLAFIVCWLTGLIGLACYAIAKDKNLESPKWDS